MAKKGSGNSYEDIKAAIEMGEGKLLTSAGILGVTRASMYSYINRFPELKKLYEELKVKSKGKAPETTEVTVDAEDAPVLTQRQVEALNLIDTRSNKGELWAETGEISTSVLLKLEERGFISLRYEDGGKWAMLTDEGEIAMLWHVVQGSREWELLMAEKGQPVRADRFVEHPKKRGRKPKVQQSIPVGDLAKKFVRPFDEAARENGGSPQAETKVHLHSFANFANAGIQSTEGKPVREVSPVEDCQCAGPCAHRRVMELLMERSPKIRKLFNQAVGLEKLLEGLDG